MAAAEYRIDSVPAFGAFVYADPLLGRGFRGARRAVLVMGGAAGDLSRSSAITTTQLQQLFNQAQKKYEGFVVATGDQLPKTKRLLEMMQAGIDGKDWYAETRQELEKTFGPANARMMVKFLVATSNNKTVAANTTLALKAFARYRMGLPFEVGTTGFDTLQSQLLEKAARGQEFGGLKQKSFEANLFGDKEAVTVDTWIRRAFGFQAKTITPAQYKFMDYRLTQIARRVGMEPRQVQAAIWTVIKEAEQKNSGNTSLPFEKLLPKNIAADPEMQELIANAKAGRPAPPRP